MPKVTFIGAGSAFFVRRIMTDILASDGLDDGEFALIDIDRERLELARAIADRLVELRGKRWRVTSSSERGDLLAGTAYEELEWRCGGINHRPAHRGRLLVGRNRSNVRGDVAGRARVFDVV